MMKRTHDQLYLNEDRYHDTKESFKFCLKLAKKHGFQETGNIYDFGCATGEFCYFLRRELKSARIFGVDILPELIHQATHHVNEVTFSVGSVLKKNVVAGNSADLSFLIGVHSIFDDPMPVFSNLIHWTKPGGLIIVFGLFNRYPLDVFLQVRRTTDNTDHKELGWNMISQETVIKHLQQNKKVKKYHFHEFSIQVDVEKHENDFLRSWTFKNIDGERLIMNGIGLLHDFQALIIQLN